MSLQVKRILNKPIDSNCFVVCSTNDEYCIIIDPSSEDCVDLIGFIESLNLKPEYIFLTHEHFDHVWCINRLKSMHDLKLIYLRDCSSMIIGEKKNMSFFYNQVGFKTCRSVIFLEDIDNHME